MQDGPNPVTGSPEAGKCPQRRSRMPPSNPLARRCLALGAVSIVATSLVAPVDAQVQPAAPTTRAIAEFQAIAEEAYLYGFPMLVAYKVLYDYNVDKNSGAYIGPFNQIVSEARVYTPKDTAVSTPNSDTPYSFVQLDLRAEPMVLCMPEIEAEPLLRRAAHRHVHLQLRLHGQPHDRQRAGCFLVAGPGWSGDMPQGVSQSLPERDRLHARRSSAPSSSAPSDMPNVEKVQAGYTIQPLSAFLEPTCPGRRRRTSTGRRFEPGGLQPGLPEVPELPLAVRASSAVPASEQALRERFASIGIERGRAVRCFDACRPATGRARRRDQGAQPRRSPQTADTVGATINGWQIGAAAGNRAFFDGDWALRAAGAKLGIYGNSSEEAAYPFTRADVNGVPLDGSQHAYTLTFPAGAMPPVNAFWSVTMYDGTTQLLIDNPIDRYLINAPMLDDLKKNPDGSLTIYIQHENPGNGPGDRTGCPPRPGRCSS